VDRFAAADRSDVMTDLDARKQQAAEAALEYVRSGMVLGLGTGSTAGRLLAPLAERLRDGRLRDIVGVPTSERTAAQAHGLGIPLATLEQRPQIDLAIDGADEIDPALNLIKGLGGALLREKIVAASAARFVVIADESKLVGQLGTRAPLPVEVVGFGLPLATRRLAELGCTPQVRRAADGTPFRTDEGHAILDCHFAGIADAFVLNAAINAIPSVVEHGLFIRMATIALIAGTAGVSTIVRAAE
jgi:ribose 5-phosphate isomerase A